MSEAESSPAPDAPWTRLVPREPKVVVITTAEARRRLGVADVAQAAAQPRDSRELVWSLMLLAVFAAFITAPFFAGVMGVKGAGTALQNRALAQKPTFTAAGLWSRTYGKAYSDWVWDHIPLRDRLLTLDHAMDVHVLGDSPSKDAFYGLGGFTWRRERILQDIRAGGSPPAELKAALDRVEAAFDAVNVPVHIVFSPTKASIYPEFLPEPYRVAHDKLAGPIERMLRERAQTDRHIVDLWTPCLTEKERLLQTTPQTLLDRAYLWRRNDDHWSYEGGWLQGKEIVRHIDERLWDDTKAPKLTGEYVMLESEISKLYLKLDVQDPYQHIKQSPLVDVRTRHLRVPGASNINFVMRSKTTAHHTPADKTILVVRDSFLSDAAARPSVTRSGSMEVIAPFFTKTMFFHWDTLAHGRAALADHVKGVDEVVIQVTQASNYYFLRRTRDLTDLARHVAAGRDAPDDDDASDDGKGNAKGQKDAPDVDPNAAALDPAIDADPEPAPSPTPKPVDVRQRLRTPRPPSND